MTITYKHIDKSFEYDGSQIEPSWAFKSFKIKGSSIITWRGPMNIKEKFLKDFEDIGLEIKSEDMIHFIVEHFDCQPANLEIAYLRQRLLVMILEEELAKNRIVSLRKGDDIFINSKKLTVSIATASISSIKIHFAMNLVSEGTPDDVDTVGLFELFNEENNSNDSINNENNYYNEKNNHLNKENNHANSINNNNYNEKNNHLNKEDNHINSINNNNYNEKNNPNDSSNNDYNIFNEKNILIFTNNVVNSYINELKSIKLDISKTNVF